MKKIILAKHTGRNDDKGIRYWEYSDETKNWWYSSESQYAIVGTKYGYQLVEVIGTAEVRDDIEVEESVVVFLSNNDFPKEADSNE